MRAVNRFVMGVLLALLVAWVVLAATAALATAHAGGTKQRTSALVADNIGAQP